MNNMIAGFSVVTQAVTYQSIALEVLPKVFPDCAPFQRDIDSLRRGSPLSHPRLRRPL